MSLSVSISQSDFYELRQREQFYIDKTGFIKEWWASNELVTLIARPRRFGKTLMMSTINYFFSLKHRDKASIFEGLQIWDDKKYQDLQGTWPVISLSFAGMSAASFSDTRDAMADKIWNLRLQYPELLESKYINDEYKKRLSAITENMKQSTLTSSLQTLSECIFLHYGKKPIILLDEYDTPMQVAWLEKYWNKMSYLMRNFFDLTFKSNLYLERAIITGITRISQESLFSGFNNPNVVTTTSNLFMTSFGFTKDEVSETLSKFSLTNKEKEVEKWYDGFTFGTSTHIYNPWSILNYLKSGGIIERYWINSGSKHLINELIRTGDAQIKIIIEKLLSNNCVTIELSEHIDFNIIRGNASAICSLLLATGYLRVVSVNKSKQMYTLQLTNLEVVKMMEGLIKDWFHSCNQDKATFLTALLHNDIKKMNDSMSSIAVETFSSFDTSGKTPENFYHAFILCLVLDLKDRFVISSNRESGKGRYDLTLEPRSNQEDAIIIEFKSIDKRAGEKKLHETLAVALQQIEDKQYSANLEAKGFAPEHIRKYGFVFKGKDVLIGASPHVALR